MFISIQNTNKPAAGYSQDPEPKVQDTTSFLRPLLYVEDCVAPEMLHYIYSHLLTFKNLSVPTRVQRHPRSNNVINETDDGNEGLLRSQLGNIEEKTFRRVYGTTKILKRVVYSLPHVFNGIFCPLLFVLFTERQQGEDKMYNDSLKMRLYYIPGGLRLDTMKRFAISYVTCYIL